MRLARPGRRARWVGIKAAYGGGVVGAVGAAGYAVLRAEATLARRTIGEPTSQAPVPDGTYGRYLGRPLRLAVIGDSSAAGLGVDAPGETPGALLAGGLARDLRRRVELDVVAAVGARSADLDVQVARALKRPIDLAVVMVGANDVTHRVPPGDAARDLGRAVRTLRAAGAHVVAGTCPDLGTVEPVLQPLRAVARRWSRRLAKDQAIAVVENGGTAVSLGDLLGPEFAESPHLWSADRFHPSAAGYRRMTDALLPSLLEAAGVTIPVSVPVSSIVQDVELAASAAAQEPGLVVETMPDAEGIAAAGHGRLTRLVRRLPLVGRGAPDERAEEGLGAPVAPSAPARADAHRPDAPTSSSGSSP